MSHNNVMYNKYIRTKQIVNNFRLTMELHKDLKSQYDSGGYYRKKPYTPIRKDDMCLSDYLATTKK